MSGINSKEGRKKVELKSNTFLQKYALILIWIVTIVIFSFMMPDIFFRWNNFAMMFGSKAVVVIVSFAVMIPLIAGDFDMSAASVLTLSAMIIAVTNVNLGYPIVVSVLLALAVSCVVGLVNGYIITTLDVNPFIVTMAVGTILNGITHMISKSLTITGVDSVLQQLTILKRVFGIPIVFLYALALMFILFYFFEYTAAGRRVLIVGRNRNVALLSGINVKRVRMFSFLSAAIISGLAGVIYAGMLGGADPSSGISFQLPAFAAIFLGAICIKPGRFNPIGTMIATYFLATGTIGLSLYGIQTFIQDIFNGTALVIAVCLTVVVKRMQDKKMAKIAKAELNEDKK